MQDAWLTVFLALLNSFQAIVLAYLTYRSHAVEHRLSERIDNGGPKSTLQPE